jgi:hypothetical protein
MTRATEIGAGLAILLLVWGGAPVARAQESGVASVSSLAPSLSLSSWGRRTVVQDRREPLLLTLDLGNPLAAARREENRTRGRHLRALAKSGVLAKMPEADREAAEQSAEPLPIPVFALGSDEDPVWEVLSVQVRTAAGKPVETRVRPLRSTTRGTRAVTLDGTGSAVLQFGLDPDALAKLPEGDYWVHVLLDTREQEDMWQGIALSGVVTLTLREGGEGAPEKSDARSARYYWLDGQYDRVEEIAQRMLARDPASIEAWTLRADVAAARGELADAERAYQLLISLYGRQHAQDPAPRPPDLLEQRLRDVQAAIAAQEAR